MLDKIWTVEALSLLHFNRFLLAMFHDISRRKLFDAAPVQFVPFSFAPRFTNLSGFFFCELHCFYTMF